MLNVQYIICANWTESICFPSQPYNNYVSTMLCAAYLYRGATGTIPTFDWTVLGHLWHGWRGEMFLDLLLSETTFYYNAIVQLFNVTSRVHKPCVNFNGDSVSMSCSAVNYSVVILIYATMKLLFTIKPWVFKFLSTGSFILKTHLDLNKQCEEYFSDYSCPHSLNIFRSLTVL